MRRNRTVKIVVCVLALVMTIAALSGCGAKKNTTITTMDGTFAETRIGAQIAKQLIEKHTDLTVNIHDAMATVPAFTALKNDEIDFNLSYDGTLLTTLMGYDPSDVPEGEDLYTWVNKTAKEGQGVMLTRKIGAENTYALAVQQDFAKEHNLKTISDLVPYAPELVFGAEHEFFDVEGTMRYIPFCEYYGFDFKDGKSIDISLKYAAMDSGNIDVTMVYSTDGMNKKYNLFILEDDKKFFPEYNEAYLMKTTLFDKYKDTAPNLEEVFNMLEGKISSDDMVNMGYEVDVNKRSPEEVAKEFLTGKGLL